MAESIEAIQVEIEHMKKDIDEVKADVKETKTMLTKNINQLTLTQIQQTEILKNQERQNAEMKEDINGLKTHVDSEIGNLRNDFKETANTHTKWYQTYLTDNTSKVFRIFMFIIIIISGVKIAITDIPKILQSFGL